MTANLPVQPPVPVGFLDGSFDGLHVTGTHGLEDNVLEEAFPQRRQPGTQRRGHGSRRAADGRTEAERLVAADNTQCGLKAAALGDVEELLRLISQGWDPHSIDKHGSNALHWAAGAGQTETCGLLIDLGIHVDYANRTGRTALHWASRNGQTGACHWLRGKGADVHTLTRDGVNVFHWAVYGGNLSTCEWALQVGVDIFALNRWGCGATHWAATTGDIALCRWLRDQGLDFALRNNQGHDGVMKAAWNGHVHLCDWLLSAEVQPGGVQYLLAVDRAGLTAIDLARLNGFEALTSKLQGLVDAHRGSATVEQLNIESASSMQAPPIQLKNKSFTVYYRMQRVAEEEEWGSVERALHQPLPITVRLCGNGDPTLLTWLTQVAGFELVPWLPASACVFQLEVKNFKANPEVRAGCSAAELAGGLTFQSTAAMLPVLLLNPLRDHLVMDMCAAPGERALQCLDAMAVAGAREGGGGLGYPVGAVLANDIDGKHFIMDSKALRTNGRPAVMVTIGNASKFPCMFEDVAAAPGRSTAPSNGAEELAVPPQTPEAEAEVEAEAAVGVCRTQLLFDRVFCSVPCSGDGLLREAPHKWKLWTWTGGLEKHTRHLKLLLRGLHYLKEGGLLCYSTASFDPLENEAVVAAALERYKGAVALVPLPSIGSEVDWMPGLQKWFVPDPAATSLFRFMAAWDEVGDDQRPPHGPVRATMFPPEAGSHVAAQLELCGRLLPNRHNSAGAFLAVFTKHTHRAAAAADWPRPAPQPLPDAPPTASTLEAVQGELPTAPTPAPVPRFCKRYTPVDAGWEQWESICRFYGLVAEALPAGHVVVQERGAQKQELRSLNLLSPRAPAAQVSGSEGALAEGAQHGVAQNEE
ncbi:hypothetical protein CYMTET_18707 [Cymbomonas tetramitiformis]|uniref:SAM-dependent MTase RsmB/NOP-type domain-containing protein n=1 Tax=Cymbomonas tetramitiformis TaxID=36881 RepID=A0AAE0L602_9CHLO|nr:hypothetical protein CYMTET_18707 [Cymbomonas tetramitiformis]